MQKRPYCSQLLWSDEFAFMVQPQKHCYELRFLIKIHGGEGAEQSFDGSWLELSAKFDFHVLSEHFAQWMKRVWASVFTVHLECCIAFSHMLKSHEHSESFT